MREFLETIKTFFKSFKRYPGVGLYPYDGFLGGVCAAIAYRLKIQTVTVRLLLLLFFLLVYWLSSLFGFLVLLIYCFLTCFLPKKEVPEDYKQVCEKEFLPWDIYRIPAAGVFGGVFTGLMYRFKIPPILTLFIRIGMVVIYLLFAGWIFFLYLTAWILLPPKEKPADFDDFCRLKKKTPSTGCPEK